MAGNNLKLADDFAADYDKSVLQNNWNGPQVIYEVSKGLLHRQAEILDLGIGTGESSRLFQNAGHRITGIDGSEKMLEQCRNKKIGSDFIFHDLEKFPYPIKDTQFDAVISNGVFHLIHPLKMVFAEVKRILKPKGIFTFSYENTDDLSEYHEIGKDEWERETPSGVLTYKYSNNIIEEYLAENKFETFFRSKFIAFNNKEINKDILFTVVVARLQNL